ncbi:MAG: hypothetical protein ACXQS4_04585, partial [Methermicoccaceae archaeon]
MRRFDLAYFKAVRAFTPEFFKPLRSFSLYKELTSNAPSEEWVGVVAGSGTNTDEVHYIDTDEIAWMYAAGVASVVGSTPDLTWNANKHVRLEFRTYTYGEDDASTMTTTIGGKASSDKNWLHMSALSESIVYQDSAWWRTGGTFSKHDLVSIGDWHMWFRNEHGDEYIKLIADAGCFT